MKAARQETYNKIYFIRNLKQQVEHVKNVLPRPDEITQQFDECLEILEKKFLELPIGHRYEGDYYMKKPGMAYPPEFEKCSGALFMREYQVSWFEDNNDKHYSFSYLRNVYKEPDVNQKLKREDGKAVFTDAGTTPHFPSFVSIAQDGSV